MVGVQIFLLHGYNYTYLQSYIKATLVYTLAIDLLHFFGLLYSSLLLTELLQASLAVLYLVVDVMSTKVKTPHAVTCVRVCVCRVT